MNRSRRDSRQRNEITPQGLSQPTFATKSANNGRSILLIANSGQLTGAQTRGLPSETALLAPTQAQKFGPDAAPAPDSKALYVRPPITIRAMASGAAARREGHKSCWGHCRRGELFL